MVEFKIPLIDGGITKAAERTYCVLYAESLISFFCFGFLKYYACFWFGFLKWNILK